MIFILLYSKTVYWSSSEVALLGPEIIKRFHMLNSPEHEICPANKFLKLLTIANSFLITYLSMKNSLLINMKMPTIIGIFIFINRENFMLNPVLHKRNFITSGPNKRLWYTEFYSTLSNDSHAQERLLPDCVDTQNSLAYASWRYLFSWGCWNIYLTARYLCRLCYDTVYSPSSLILKGFYRLHLCCCILCCRYFPKISHEDKTHPFPFSFCMKNNVQIVT